MDKSWIDDEARHTKVYLQGVNSFLAYAFRNSAVGSKILCPCRKCVNSYWREASEVREHLICDGFLKGYRTWNLHGEANLPADNIVNCDGDEFSEDSDEEDDISGLLRDLACGLDDRGELEDDVTSEESNEDLLALQKLVEENSQELYPSCKKYSKLRFLIRLLHIKLLGGWTDRSFDLLLDLLNDAFPNGSTLPRNFHEAKKLVKSIGLGYVSIHACENDCILFSKEHANYNSCPRCKVSRWKSEKKSLDGKRVYKVPRKVLRYFPIKKRLRRLFVSSKFASLTRWHDEERTKDGILRHPADSPLWKEFDQKHPEFAADSRNIRLAYATDGFNPFRSMKSNYSIWPGILIPYNFPPSMCIKQSNFILSLVIPGRNALGSDMDVYLQPLVYDLLDMFVDGVRTYDASRCEWFQLHAAVIWTITDLPGLSYVSGCVTSGEAGCPDCHLYTFSLRLSNGTKTCYMDHRRFLPANHPFRFDVDRFNGEIEWRLAPTPLSGEEVLELTENLNTVYGKDPSRKKPSYKGRRKKGDPLVIFKRRPIWFILPYWKDLMLRHNFDVMHIGKNVCDNIVNTLLDLDGKSKDNLNSRLDLQALGIRSDLHPIEVEGGKLYLPPAPYSMSPAERKLFCEVLKGVKFPDGYASDIRHNVHVKERKIIGLKSHDSHILLQHLLPLAVRRILPEIVSAALIQVSNFFKKICSPVIRTSDMHILEAEIAETLSLLETIFPPSFFDSMVHLMVHLPAQARIAGPVHFRSMWPVERYLMRCEGYVRTKSHPEGSIMEGSLFDESLTHCSRYLQCETRVNQQARNGERLQTETSITSFFNNIGRGLTGKCIVNLEHKTWLQAHRYVLFNYSNMEQYLNKHVLYLSSIGFRNKRDINRMQHESFHEWFRLHVEGMCEDVPDDIKTLAKGPLTIARKYNSYMINDFSFHTQSYDESKSVQSSGVAVVAETSSFEMGNNDNITIGKKIYYGIIKEIIELNYQHKGNVVLFKCDWVDNRGQNRWIKMDHFGITNVNFKHLFNTGEKISDEPFILASQAIQVYYVRDPIDNDWFAVVQSKPRDLYGIDYDENENQDTQTRPLHDLHGNMTVDVIAGPTPCARTDIDGEKMSSVQGKERSLLEIEKQRFANIAANNRKLEALKIPHINTVLQEGRPKKKRTKRNHQTNNAASEGYNLRPKQRDIAQNEVRPVDADLDCQVIGEFLDDNEDSAMGNGTQKRKGRSITRKDNIFSRTPDMPKLTITINEYGQPIGENSRQLSNVIGCQVRKKIPLACDDWRNVDAENKYKLWTDIKAFYELDDSAFNWFMTTAGKK